MADSLNAGNCAAGTRAFAVRHGLDVGRHHSAAEIAEIANGDWDRARLAIACATLRHRREMAAGACVLAEHH
jgi:hypothetical protein